MNRHLLLLAFFLLAALPHIMAQTAIHDGTIIPANQDPHSSAVLDVKSTDKGVLVPRVDIANLATAAPVTAPAEGLLVYNTNGTTGEGYYYWNGTIWTRIVVAGDQGSFWRITGNSGTAVASNFIGTTDNVSVAFRTNNTERMRLQSGGQLTIGATAAGAKLDVHQTTATAVSRFTTYGNVPLLEVRRTGGTQASPSATSSTNTVLARIDGQGYNGSGYTGAARIEMATDAAGGTSSDMPGRITFSTTPDGSGTLAERMRIASSGDIGIGTITAPATLVHMGSLTDATTASQILTVESMGFAGMHLTGDRGNIGGEPGGAFVRLSQDALAVQGIFGVVNVAGQDGSGAAFTGTEGNSVVVGNKFSGPLHLGANNNVRMTIASNGTARLHTYTTNGLLKTTSGNGTLAIATGADLPSGSGNYIQNQTTLQTTSNFHISGTGRAVTSFQAPLYTRADAGTVGIRPFSNSTTAIQLQNATGTSILNVDATNSRVGIGTTTPGQALEVNGRIRLTSSQTELYQSVNRLHVRAENVDGVAQFATYGMFLPRTGQAYNLYLAGSMQIGYSESNPVLSYLNGDLRFASGATERMRLTAAGNLGIGTTAPATKLQVTGGHGDTQARLTLPAGSNGGGTGEVNLQLWVSEPGITWDAGGIGMNVTNNNGSPAGFGRINSSLGQSYIRFIPNGGAMAFNTTNNAGTYYQTMYMVNGNVGMGTTAPGHKLQVEGNARVTGYILAGNPSAPATTPGGSYADLYSTGDEGWSGWLAENVCGGAGANWGIIYTGSTTENNYAVYDNIGSRTRKNFYSPWMWVASGASAVRAYGHFFNSLESTYDGVFLEYSTNGTAWTKITSFAAGGYNATTQGSNTACNAANAQVAWSNSGWTLFGTNNLPLSGTWVRFRFVGFEDASNASGAFLMYRFTLEGNLPSVGGAFATGHIYAQNNVYAGSNVLLGDVAEYFPVMDRSEPGDLISIDPLMPDRYLVSSKANDQNVLGVYSTNPTVTLNDPNSGVPVALRGRVPVKVCGQTGPIRPGDLLTSSNLRGHAMKATSAGYVVGRALEYFDGKGQGTVLCLIENGWYNPSTGNPVSSGTFNIRKGDREISVKDAAITSESKVFITMLGDPGSRFWIKKKADGEFIIALSETSSNEVPFDYLVENADKNAHNAKPDPVGTIADVAFEKPSSEGWMYDEEKKVYWRNVATDVPQGFTKTPAPAYTESSAPSIPENETMRYVFYQDRGIVPYEGRK
jgi:hypothetical protein